MGDFCDFPIPDQQISPDWIIRLHSMERSVLNQQHFCSSLLESPECKLRASCISLRIWVGLRCCPQRHLDLGWTWRSTSSLPWWYQAASAVVLYTGDLATPHTPVEIPVFMHEQTCHSLSRDGSSLPKIFKNIHKCQHRFGAHLPFRLLEA